MATRKTSTLTDIPEITTGAENEAFVMPDEVEAPKAKTKATATVTRQFVANDYLTERHASAALYEDVMAELGDVDPWSVKITLKMGRKPQGEADAFYIRVNGRKYELAYRQTHEVPLPIAMAWLDHEASNEIAADIADAMTDNYQKLANEKIL